MLAANSYCSLITSEHLSLSKFTVFPGSLQVVQEGGIEKGYQMPSLPCPFKHAEIRKQIRVIVLQGQHHLWAYPIYLP